MDLKELWEKVNALGGCRPTERNYDQGYVDAISDVLNLIEASKEEDPGIQADMATPFADNH
jgi:hypothetical protein